MTSTVPWTSPTGSSSRGCAAPGTAARTTVAVETEPIRSPGRACAPWCPTVSRPAQGRGGEPPAALQAPPPAAAGDSTTDTKADDVTENDVAYDGSPVVIRQKKHPASPMTVDDALYRMEMVGHDFFLFIDSETSNPKVVYRRKGWNYGVIELEQEPAAS